MSAERLRELSQSDRWRIRCNRCDEEARYGETVRSVVPPDNRIVLSFYYWCLACAVEQGIPTPRWKEHANL